MASTTCGWQWPVLVTAMPLEKSRYSTPSVVVTMQPDPEATSRSVTRNHTSATPSATVGPPLPRYASQPSDGPPLPSGPCSTSAASAPNPTPCAPGSPGAVATRRPASIASSSSTCGNGRWAPSATTCGPGSRSSRRRSASGGARATPTAAEALMAESRALGERERALDAEVERIAAEVRDLLLRTPNLPSPTAPTARARRTTWCCGSRASTRTPTARTSGCRTGTSAPSSASSTASGRPRSPARCSRCTGAGEPGCCERWCSSASTATPTPTRSSARPPSCAPTR